MEMISFLVGSFKAGGIFMYAILLVLAIGTAIFFERILSLHVRNSGKGHRLWSEIKERVERGAYGDALETCHKAGTFLAHVLGTGLKKKMATDNREEIQGAFEEALLEVQPALEKRIHYLYALSNVSTLLGLLGTVTGLIQSFTAVSEADPSRKSALLASGISLALNNTAFGLLVAILLMVSYSLMQSRSTAIEDELDEYSLKLLHMMQGSGRPSQ